MKPEKLFNFLDWLTYFILGIIGLVFVFEANVIEKYSGRHTDFYVSEEDPKDLTWPQVSVCDLGGRLMKFSNQLRVTYQIRDTISYKAQDVANFTLKPKGHCYLLDLPEDLDVPDTS